MAYQGGLRQWHKEKWIDTKTNKPCGRSKGEKRGVPACRPTKRVNSKTPTTAGEMTAAQKRKFKARKTALGQPPGKPRRVKRAA